MPVARGRLSGGAIFPPAAAGVRFRILSRCYGYANFLSGTPSNTSMLTISLPSTERDVVSRGDRGTYKPSPYPGVLGVGRKKCYEV